MEIVATFDSSEPKLQQLRQLARNTFATSLIQSEIPCTDPHPSCTGTHHPLQRLGGAVTFRDQARTLARGMLCPFQPPSSPLTHQPHKCSLAADHTVASYDARYDSNLMSVQSDCPHRERFGYGGDALGCGEAGISIYDFEAFYAKRIRDFVDAQIPDPRLGVAGFPETAPSVGISDGGVGPAGSGPIGWQAFQPEAQLWLYKYYGDVHTLTECFNATHAFVKMLDTDPAGIEHGLGDWMPIDQTSTAFTGMAFQRMSYLAFANISSIVGAHGLETEYRAKAAHVASEMNARFLDAASGVYHTHGATASNGRNDTQTGQGLALFSHLCPDVPTCARTLQVLAENARGASFLPGACRGSSSLPGCNTARGGAGSHLTAGLFGIKWVLLALADGGMNDLALEMLTSTTFPSFGWMQNNPFANATTIWESWFFSDNTFSHNHPMFSSSEVWLLQSVAGIQPHPSARGMHRVLIKPSPPTQLQFVRASFSTPRGLISVSWARAGDGAPFSLNVSIPPNVRATVHVPTSVLGRVLEGGRGVTGGRRVVGDAGTGSGESLAIEVGSGFFEFLSF